jgi:hypothetical protein
VLELIQRLEGAQARLLDEILSVRGVTRQTQRRPIHVIEVDQDMLLEAPDLIALPADAHTRTPTPPFDKVRKRGDVFPRAGPRRNHPVHALPKRRSGASENRLDNANLGLRIESRHAVALSKMAGDLSVGTIGRMVKPKKAAHGAVASSSTSRNSIRRWRCRRWHPRNRRSP